MRVRGPTGLDLGRVSTLGEAGFEVDGDKELYSLDTIEKVENGTVYGYDQDGELSDLPFLKSETGAQVRRSQTVGVGTAFQSPISAFLAVHRAF